MRTHDQDRRCHGNDPTVARNEAPILADVVFENREHRRRERGDQGDHHEARTRTSAHCDQGRRPDEWQEVGPVLGRTTHQHNLADLHRANACIL